MELLFATVIAAGIGGIVRYLVPQRRTYGLLLLPAIAAAVGAVVWVAALWAGATFDGTWIWVVSLGAALAAALITALVLPRRRVASDAAQLHHLSGGKA